MLTISGEGETEDYTYADTPWSAYRETIKAVVIGEGVTQLKSGVFQDCSAVTEVSLPYSITRIGYQAFAGCTALTEIVIPDGVTKLSAAAFRDCPLTEVTVPASVEEIGNEAFSCPPLTDITILNPACSLFDGAGTVCSSATVHGYAGSSAEEYAGKYSRRFEAIARPAPVSGDLNGDGDVTVADAVLLIRFFTEDGSLELQETGSILTGNPDINGDGLVTITDVTELLHQHLTE